MANCIGFGGAPNQQVPVAFFAAKSAARENRANYPHDYGQLVPRIFSLVVAMGVLLGTDAWGAQLIRADALKRAGFDPDKMTVSQALVCSIGEVVQSGRHLLIPVDDTKKTKQLRIPRLNNVVQRIVWLNDPEACSQTLTQTPREWTIHLSQKPRSASPVVCITLDTKPYLPLTPWVAKADAQGVIHLAAQHGEVHGEKLQFEPQPHKNTIGYWVNSSDWVSWTLEVGLAGHYDIQLLQGCGRGQGGSEVELRVGGNTLRFEVAETGHFQCFRWVDLGTISLSAGRHDLELRPLQIAQQAVMDVRAIRLRPQQDETSRSPSRPPNVVIIYTDDQGTLDAGCYGSRDLFTPNIDGLAASGVRFTQAYAHTVCCPSRALLLTGRHPQRGGVNQWLQGNMKATAGLNMSLDELTLAEVFQEAGYQTALFGTWHLGAAATHGPTKQGFHHFFGHRGGFIDNFNHFYLHQEGFHDLYRATREVFHPGKYFPDLVVAETERFLERNRDRPHFVYVAMNTPHYPEQPDAMFDQFYAHHPMPRRLYGQFVSTTDERVGRILRKLDLLGLAKDTIVVFASDNGHSEEDYQILVEQHASGYPQGHNYGPLGGGGYTGKWRGSKNTFFEGGLRVPAIISAPGRIPAGVVRDQIITAADWFPTLIELTGVDRPDVELDGASLVPIIRHDAPSHHEVLHWQWFDRWAVRQAEWKLIHDRRLVSENHALDYLGNLADEHPETKNYASQRPELVRQLTELHNAWLRNVTPQ